jgi:DNA repair protein RecN (Recombination protein N)
VLRQLSIHNVVLIDRLELEFEPGLGVLTGETGAGKSILLDSLGLALGMRADTGLVRSGEQQSAVAALFEIASDNPAHEVLSEQGIDVEPGEPLIVRRTLKADGGSRAFAGGASVNAALLRDLASGLVEIHGQHDDRGLLNPKGHRALLDTFARIDTNAIAAAWAEICRLETELGQARADAEAAERDREWLEYSANEIAALAPLPGEESELAEARAAMQAGAKAGESLTGLDELLSGSDGALAQLRAAARRIERGAPDHPLLAEALASLDRAVIETSEAEDKIARAADALAFDPARLESAEARLFDIRGLARKHRVEPDALAALAEELSAKRSEAAARLDQAVAGELAPLKLDAARLRTAIASGEPGPAGVDRVEFEVSTNPGAPFGALTRIASGGELSRFILALKVALAEEGGAATMIFDEIDRGVGGAVASAIGERLARLAAKGQLLVVTHSPQVAARAAHHYRIEKAHGEGGTRTTVRKLSAEERREEIARMLSGADITDEARAQAARLLEAA